MSQETWNQSAFVNRTTSAVASVIFRNINQSSHWLTYCAGSGTSGGTIEIDGSADGVNWVTISNLGSLQANTCGAIQGGGYYPDISAKPRRPDRGWGPDRERNLFCVHRRDPHALQYWICHHRSASNDGTDHCHCSRQQCLKSTASQLSTVTSNNVLYGATVFNPNSGTVLCRFWGQLHALRRWRIQCVHNSSGSGAGGGGVAAIAGTIVLQWVRPLCCLQHVVDAAPRTRRLACVVSSYWKQVSGRNCTQLNRGGRRLAEVSRTFRAIQTTKTDKWTQLSSKIIGVLLGGATQSACV